MIRCKDYAHALSKEEDISKLKRWDTRFHQFICTSVHCKNYYKQLVAIKNICKRLFTREVEAHDLENTIQESVKKVLRK